jgi:hypothetical protein
LNRDDVNALADLPFVNALADRAYVLDHTFMGHAPHALRAGLVGTAPAQLGGRPDEAKRELETAIAATGGKNLMYLVLEARLVAVALQDRALYKRLLTTVIDAPTDLDIDQRLLNQLAKRRAVRYLAEIDLLFEPEQPPPSAEPASLPASSAPGPAGGAPAPAGTGPNPLAPAAPAAIPPAPKPLVPTAPAPAKVPAPAAAPAAKPPNP